MGLSVDASENYKAWGNTRAIRYTRLLQDGMEAEYEIAIAKPRAISFKELAGSGGVYVGQDRVWLLPAVLVAAAEGEGVLLPKAGDWLTIGEDVAGDEAEQSRGDSSELAKWTVLEAGLNTLRSTWRLVTRNLAIVNDLYELLSIKRPALASDAAGGRDYSTYTTVYQNVACRFQEVSADAADERGQRLTVKRYLVPVERRLRLTIEDIAVDHAGNIYEIKGWHDADRIDQLQQLECERRW